MTEIERAIETLEERFMTMSMCGDIEYCKAQNRALDIAIAALREQAEREKGCEYCNDQEVIAWDMCNDGIVIESNGKMHMLSGGDWEAEIDFCPMCGKRLEVEP